jgi:1-acyl-sn-glycerol-3-phosphate acyltransferase
MTILRSLLFTLYFWSLSAVMTVGLSPLLFIGPRRWIIWAMRSWAVLSLSGLARIAGIRMELRGRAHIPQGGGLIAAKHQSMWETLVFHLLLADPAMVMKSELKRIPLYGRYAERAEMIIVERKGGAKALRALMTSAKARLAQGRQIVIFPEGTRVAPGAPAAYKPGVAALYAALGVPCIPVALDSGLFWPRRGVERKPGTIVIEFLAPIPPGLEREVFMARLEAAIEAATRRLLATGSDSSDGPCG